MIAQKWEELKNEENESNALPYFALSSSKER